jgi:putative heme iron utilization protein
MSDGFEARRLIREARQASLATAAGGAPQLGLVTPATDPGLDILLLLSGLSAHTRALIEHPACGLLFIGAPAGANPQMTPRVAVTGVAERLDRGSPGHDAARARYLAVHPYAALYVDFDDFSLWRLRPETANHVAGFGRARKLSGDALRPKPSDVASIEAAASSLIGQAGAAPGEIAGLDCDGVDLVVGEATERRSFQAADPQAWLAGFTNPRTA